MGLIVITGGARSGKSHVAERLASRCVGDISVAVFGQGDDDREMADRILRHKQDRPMDWRLIEAQDSVEWTERVGSDALLVDCLGTLLGRVMEEVLAEAQEVDLRTTSELPQGFEAEVERRFAAIIGWILRHESHSIVVTNEVGTGVVPPYPSGRVFRDVLGRANRTLVNRADRSYLVVAGRVLDLTELPTEGTWPWHEQGCD